MYVYEYFYEHFETHSHKSLSGCKSSNSWKHIQTSPTPCMHECGWSTVIIHKHTYLYVNSLKQRSTHLSKTNDNRYSRVVKLCVFIGWYRLCDGLQTVTRSSTLEDKQRREYERTTTPNRMFVDAYCDVIVSSHVCSLARTVSLREAYTASAVSRHIDSQVSKCMRVCR